MDKENLRIDQDIDFELLENVVSHDNQELNRETTDEQREKVRSKVTLAIVWLYVACISMMVAAGVIAPFFHDPLLVDRTINSLKQVEGFAQALLLPIITLVLGFYFGSEKR
jgi:hypothetical protein